jgi:prepilin-type N-terminal cleavage/methylation domain-containing protein
MGRFAGRCARLRAARGRVHEASGFTIIEMLIAMTVLLIGMLGTFLLVGTANGNLSKTKAREGATNLARELLESSRETAYANVGQSGWFTSTLQNASGGSGSVTFPATNSARTTVTRRKVSYTTTVSWCSLDDSGDGYGTHASSTAWCSGSGTTGTTDSQAEDFKRVSAAVSWTFEGVTQPTLTQTATFSSTGAVVGPPTTSLSITSPSGLDPTTPTITSNPSGGIVTFVGSATGAADMKFSINGVEQASGVVNNGNGTWSFNWNITTLADGNFTIGAVAIDALGTRGQPRSLTVKLARGAATAPQNVTGGYNYIYVSGVKTLVVELDWDASPEGSVTGYDVRNGATVECSTSLTTNCIDFTPASTGSTTYSIRTYYTDGAGNTQFVTTSYTVAAPLSLSFVRNLGQASCTSGGTMTITVPAAGVAAGDSVIVRLMQRGVSGGAVGASDSRGNTYSADVDAINIDQREVLFRSYMTTALVGGDTITVTFPSASTSEGVVADDFTGLTPPWASGALDATGTGGGNSSTPSASATTSNGKDLLIGGVSNASNLSGTQPSGWTALTNQTPSCGGGASGNATNLGGYAVVSSPGTYAYNPTLSSNARWADGIAAYKANPTLGVQQPGVPTGLTITDNGDGTRTLRWTAPSSTNPAVDFYRIYRDGSNYTNRLDTVGDTQTCPSSTQICWTDTATGGTSHTYRVTSASHNLTESDMAGPVSG